MSVNLKIVRVLILVAMAGGCIIATEGQPASESANILIPPSSIANFADAGVRAHTNIRIMGPGGQAAQPRPSGPPFSGYYYQTPASIACIYELRGPTRGPTAGCDSNTATATPAGGSRAIAVVDAYDDPNAYADLGSFSTQFGLMPITPANFVIVYAPAGYWARHMPTRETKLECSGTNARPASAASTGWDVEESLDIEWVHAMAPMATLYLVEAQSDYLDDLLCAVAVASDLVVQAGGGEVSISWGTLEFPGETLLDSTFDTPQVVYLAASGDAPGVSWPSSSPNVVSVGGTTLNTNSTTGKVELESSWEGTGGGQSAYEPSPGYQNSISPVAGQYRATPDISAVANPYTGVWVLDTLEKGSTWYIVGGTSVPTALMAGIVNAASSFFESSAAELGSMYEHFRDFEDVKVGSCGLYLGIFATAGWDFCTGLGSPRGYAGK